MFDVALSASYGQYGNYGLYFLLVAGIIVLPGMDMAFVMASALTGGRRAGAAALAGIVVGGMVHVAVSGLGLGLVLMSAPGLFNGLLLAGALYIAWIGISLLRDTQALAVVPVEQRRLWPATFARGLLTCLCNPKAYVFMLAVFPQFLRPAQGALWPQALVLGAIGAFTQVAVYGAVALAAASLQAWLRGNASAQITLARCVGVGLLLMAAWTLLQGWQRVA
jgi:threonine/homoserine/homoserine lactone efflux protein